jgi:protein-S-isoprenylcysteine O-methyltransferase Ste14
MAKLKLILYWLDVTFFLVWATLLVEYSRGLRFYAGMALAAVAFVFWMTARFQLGRSFSVTAKAQNLVTTGLYSKIRNPIYVFGALAFMGLAIAWGNPVGFLYVVCGTPLQFLRTRNEEAVLEQAFGEKYRIYKAGTWF